MGEKAINNLTNEREWLIWIQKLKDKDGGLNDLRVLVNLPGLCNILLVSVSINFDSIRAIYLPTDQVYCRFVLVIESFLAFHFCTIIIVSPKGLQIA